MVQFIDYLPLTPSLYPLTVEKGNVITGGSNFLKNVYPLYQNPASYYYFNGFPRVSATPLGQTSLYQTRPYINFSQLQTRSI